MQEKSPIEKNFEISKYNFHLIIRTIVIKLLIIILGYYLFMMLGQHKTFWETTNWFFDTVTDVQSNAANSILFVLSICGLYTLSSIILDIVQKPCTAYEYLYSDGWVGYSGGFVRKALLWIIGICGSVALAGFIWTQVLLAPFGIPADAPMAIVVIIWIFFFLIRDIYRLIKFSIQYFQYYKQYSCFCEIRAREEYEKNKDKFDAAKFYDEKIAKNKNQKKEENKRKLIEFMESKGMKEVDPKETGLTKEELNQILYKKDELLDNNKEKETTEK